MRLARFGARVPKVPAYAEAFRAIGPAAIKLGQALATRPDLVGDAAANDLQTLQDSLPPLPFATIRAAIERGLARPIEDLFASIEEMPVGAASIAQVHRAVTTDGRTVAVKIIHPHLLGDDRERVDDRGRGRAPAEDHRDEDRVPRQGPSQRALRGRRGCVHGTRVGAAVKVGPLRQPGPRPSGPGAPIARTTAAAAGRSCR